MFLLKLSLASLLMFASYFIFSLLLLHITASVEDRIRYGLAGWVYILEGLICGGLIFTALWLLRG